MRVTGFNGADQGPDDAFNITTVSNTPPSLNPTNPSVAQNHWVRAAQFLNYSDSNGDAAVQFEFQDSTTGASSAYFWTPGAGQQPAGATSFVVNAADINDLWIRGGAAGGSDVMFVRAFDGTDWGTTSSFTVNTVAENAPVVTIDDQSLSRNLWAPVSALLHYTDVEGDPAVQYNFFDNGSATDSAYLWMPDTGRQPANSSIIVNASDLNNLWIRAGAVTGSEVFGVRAFDGTNWGNFDTFTLTTTT